MRKVTMTVGVGTDPTPEKGKSGPDYVKFRVASQEYNEGEPWWMTVMCYGKIAKTVLEKVKKRDRLLIDGKMLQPYGEKQNISVILSDFEFLPKQNVETEKPTGDDFDFDSFDQIAEIEF